MNGHLVFRTVVLLFLTFEEISPTCLTNPSVTGGHLGIFGANSFVLVPSINFNCSGNTTSLRWEVTQFGGNPNTPRRIDLQIWRQTISIRNNNIDYTRVYNEVVIVTESTTSTNIFTITPTVATTYESGDIVGFYIPTQGATAIAVDLPFGSAEGHSYYYVSASSPSSEEILNTQSIVFRTRAPFLQISAIPTSSEEMSLSVRSVLSTYSESAMSTKTIMQTEFTTSSMTLVTVTQTTSDPSTGGKSTTETDIAKLSESAMTTKSLMQDVTSNPPQENGPESSSASVAIAETCNGAIATNMYTEREQILSAVFGIIIFILLLLIAGENLFLVVWFISKRRHSNKRSTSSVEPTSNPSATSTATMRLDNSVYYTTVKDVDSTQSKMGASVVIETNPCYQSVEPA